MRVVSDKTYRAQARCELVAESDEHMSYGLAVTEAKERLLAAEKLAFSINGVTTTGMGVLPMSDKFFEALEKAKVTDAAVERVADLERQLAQCKAAMRQVAGRLNHEPDADRHDMAVVLLEAVCE